MQDINFFDNLKSIIEDSGKTSHLVFSQLSNSSFDRINQDVRTVYCRTSLIRLLIVLKLLNIPNIHNAIQSDLKKLIPFGKDVMYKLIKRVDINWRRLLLRQSYTCTQGVSVDGSFYKDDPCKVSCFILDDTDLPKRGKRMEFIGKIFSHVTHRYELGYKSLNLAWWSGKHLLHVDFSIHVEMGKNKNQGMRKKHLKNRYSKSRDKISPSYQRVSETMKKKTQSAISMIRRATAKGFTASYILADSWFFNSTIAQFAIKKGIHLISRPKFNNWKYTYNQKEYTIGDLCKKLRYTRDKKWNKSLRFHHLSIHVIFKDTKLKLFLYKEKRRGSKWQAIITTDTTLGSIQAYKIYQNRWTIEVSYKELKQYFRFGKCQAQDFDAQIADATQSIMAYNYISQIKAVQEHQSIGQLFAEISKQYLSPTIMEKFWKLLFQCIIELAELFEKSVDELLEKIFQQNQFFKKLHNLNLYLTAET